jgi:hypothetical protein
MSLQSTLFGRRQNMDRGFCAVNDGFSFPASAPTAVNRRLLLVVLALAGCGGARAPGGPDAAAPGVPMVTGTAPALAVYASQRMMVLPAQAIRPGDVLGWASDVANHARLLSQLDSTLSTEFRGRGLSPQWATAGDLDRIARRNPVHVTRLADIRAGAAVRALERSRDDDIPEPTASQLRVLAGFHEARYALVPTEVRFERGEFADAGRALLRVGILDVRGSSLVFIGDIVGPDAGDATTALVNLGRRFADLIVTR